MQEVLSAEALANIHFPQRTDLIKRLRRISFVINDIVLLIAILLLLAWIINIPSLSTFLFGKLAIYPFSSVLYILSGTTLLFGAKRHLMSTHEDAKEDKDSWWRTWIPLSLAAITAVLGFANVAHLTDAGVLSLFHVAPIGGLCFFLIGIALIPPFTRVRHRFHFTQFFVFIVSGLSVFVVLESLYQRLSPLPTQQIVPIPLSSDLLLTIFCFSILLRWTNRGFLGNFTLDSSGSIFAFRLFALNLITAPLIALVVLFVLQKTHYNMYQILTVVVVCFTVISSAFLWVNVKLLYKYGLEHLLMRESLRAHNIDLAAEKEALRKRMVQLEQEKRQYQDKLNTQSTLRDVIGTQQ
jgi:hypothetical protein